MAELRNIVISVLILTLVFVGFIGLYGHFSEIYIIPQEGKLNDTHPYDKTNQTYDMIVEMKNKVYNNTITDEQALDFSIRNAYASIRNLIGGSIDTIRYITWQVQAQLGLPAFLVKMFLTAVLAFIIFAFIALFTRKVL